MKCAERRAALVLAVAIVATPVSAHGLDARQGSVVVRSDRVEVTLEAETDAREAALAQLVLRDERGARLSGRIVSAQVGNAGGHVLLDLEYVLVRPLRWLSFRLAEEGSTPSRPRRLVLSVRDESDGEPTLLTLTSGGNVETLRLAGPEPAWACGVSILDRHPERLREVVALWREESRSARLDVVLPLGVLESWLPVPRSDADSIGVAEQRAAQSSLTGLVAARILLVADDGAQVPPSGSEVVFLGLDDAALGPPPDGRPLDAWTARVRVSLHFDRPGRLQWDLWNARVTTARIVVLDGGGCAERRLSTYDPSL